MGIFNDMLGAGESLFKDPVALDYDYMPKVIRGREEEQRKLAFCIKPLDQKRNGTNIILFGPSGIGKTVVCKHMLKLVEEETDEIMPVYVNCWKKNTSYKVAIELCEQLGYRLTHNKKTDELLDIAVKLLNKRSAVFVFDEIDKAEELDFLYSLLEGVYRKSMLIITNEVGWANNVDPRIKSRLMIEMMEFKSYGAKETEDILKYRGSYAFVDGVWDDNAFNVVVKKAVELQDVRSGLYLMRESGNVAERRGGKKIEVEDVNNIIGKLDDFTIKSTSALDAGLQFVLSVVKENPKMKIGELYEKYKEKGGDKTYKTFQRSIKKLSDNKFISTETIKGGTSGSTTLIDYSKMKKLTEF